MLNRTCTRQRCAGTAGGSIRMFALHRYIRRVKTECSSSLRAWRMESVHKKLAAAWHARGIRPMMSWCVRRLHICRQVAIHRNVIRTQSSLVTRWFSALNITLLERSFGSIPRQDRVRHVDGRVGQSMIIRLTDSAFANNIWESRTLLAGPWNRLVFVAHKGVQTETRGCSSWVFRAPLADAA